MRGGARPGAGRKRGGRNRAAAETVLLARTEYVTGQKMLARDVLDWLMHQFQALAASAREANDAAGFIRYGTLARDVAKELAPYQSPKLTAVAALGSASAEPATRFQLRIFDCQRRPLLLDGPTSHDANTRK
jgi:hypothetical protein